MCFGVHAAVSGYARDGPPPRPILTPENALRDKSGPIGNPGGPQLLAEVAQEVAASVAGPRRDEAAGRMDDASSLGC